MTQDWKTEFVKWFHEDPGMELANGVGTPENIADWWMSKLKEEREKTKVETLEKALEWFGHYDENGKFVYDYQPRSVKEIVAEQRLAVLSEVEREVGKLVHKDNVYSGLLSEHDISNIINNLRVK